MRWLRASIHVPVTITPMATSTNAIASPIGETREDGDDREHDQVLGTHA